MFQRGNRVAELELPQDLDQPIKQILIFGSWIVACASTRVEIWKTSTLEHYTTIHSVAGKQGDNELTGGVCTMPTFLNKVFVGRRDGWVEIWNISTGRLIYTILPPSPTCGSVTCLEPTPALSLLAISYSAGPWLSRMSSPTSRSFNWLPELQTRQSSRYLSAATGVARALMGGRTVLWLPQRKLAEILRFGTSTMEAG